MCWKLNGILLTNHIVGNELSLQVSCSYAGFFLPLFLSMKKWYLLNSNLCVLYDLCWDVTSAYNTLIENLNLKLFCKICNYMYLLFKKINSLKSRRKNEKIKH